MGSAVNRPSLRTEQAAQTRARILDAARAAFERRGYGGARIEEIAAQAGVAVPTVYKVFTNKRTLLAGVVARAMVGTPYTGNIEEQEWWQEQLNEPDPARQLRLIARNARRIYDGAATVLEILRASARLHPEIAAVWDDVAEQRMERARRTAPVLLAKAGGRARFDVEETAISLWSLTVPEIYTAHMGLGRDPDQYESWLGDVLTSTLLIRDGSPSPRSGACRC